MPNQKIYIPCSHCEDLLQINAMIRNCPHIQEVFHKKKNFHGCNHYTYFIVELVKNKFKSKILLKSPSPTTIEARGLCNNKIIRVIPTSKRMEFAIKKYSCTKNFEYMYQVRHTTYKTTCSTKKLIAIFKIISIYFEFVKHSIDVPDSFFWNWLSIKKKIPTGTLQTVWESIGDLSDEQIESRKSKRMSSEYKHISKTVNRDINLIKKVAKELYGSDATYVEISLASLEYKINYRELRNFIGKLRQKFEEDVLNKMTLKG